MTFAIYTPCIYHIKAETVHAAYTLKVKPTMKKYSPIMDDANSSASKIVDLVKLPFFQSRLGLPERIYVYYKPDLYNKLPCTWKISCYHLLPSDGT